MFKPINGDYHASLLKRLRQSVNDKHRGKIRRDALEQQDDATVHTSQIAKDAVKVM